MVHQFGDMFKETLGIKDNLIVTTNSYITQAGKLVMGRGAAKTLAMLVPDIASKFGKQIKHFSEYWLKDSGYVHKGITRLWAFQVKTHFKKPASIFLIRTTTMVLKRQAILHPDKEYHMNYPGIGNGQLKFEVVEPVVETLPNNVFIWRFK